MLVHGPCTHCAHTVYTLCTNTHTCLYPVVHAHTHAHTRTRVRTETGAKHAHAHTYTRNRQLYVGLYFVYTQNLLEPCLCTHCVHTVHTLCMHMRTCSDAVLYEPLYARNGHVHSVRNTVSDTETGVRNRSETGPDPSRGRPGTEIRPHRHY